ncbi:hypothetical protein [Trueperella pecoris]|uniref:hypothetical protein n=1 Tax=Trueperella pecoris TaxID=2733571 RepID=UPI00186B7366|nr:hypothetical protein [Trueperella pecoris]QOQ38186.1 hypothetical protein HLG82_01135 [Trueperella pecoris]
MKRLSNRFAAGGDDAVRRLAPPRPAGFAWLVAAEGFFRLALARARESEPGRVEPDLPRVACGRACGEVLRDFGDVPREYGTPERGFGRRSPIGAPDCCPVASGR